MGGYGRSIFQVKLRCRHNRFYHSRPQILPPKRSSSASQQLVHVESCASQWEGSSRFHSVFVGRVTSGPFASLLCFALIDPEGEFVRTDQSVQADRGGWKRRVQDVFARELWVQAEIADCAPTASDNGPKDDPASGDVDLHAVALACVPSSTGPSWGASGGSMSSWTEPAHGYWSEVAVQSQSSKRPVAAAQVVESREAVSTRKGTVDARTCLVVDSIGRIACFCVDGSAHSDVQDIAKQLWIASGTMV